MCFFVICKTLQEGGEAIPIYKSEAAKMNQDVYQWTSVKLLTSSLCGENEFRPISIEFY